jgi:imidazolonepropionase-like amidohydrolase
MWITNADLCRLEGRIGLIAPGAFGDLVVSRVDPFADIVAFADVDASLSHVIQAGRVVVER